MEPTRPRPRRPSKWWPILAALCGVLSIGALVAALAVQRSASEPIGEGELFVADAMAAATSIEAASDLDVGVRRARNELEIEAVTLVDASGTITASTSPNLVGKEITNSFLAFSMREGRFAALATPIESPIILNGVPAWNTGDVLYQVASPLSDGTTVLLHYDISELLSRRARTAGIQPETIQLIALTALLAVIGVAIGIGHLRAARRYEALVKESELLRKHADELARANVQLDRARNEAERALELAEEKIRIRSDFVLMINHELRTPLTSVITGAKILRDDSPGPEDRRQVLEAMVEDGTRLAEMIDQILAVARIENKKLFYELAETPIRELGEALSAADAEVVADTSDHADKLILTDVNALGLVVSSLADNARTHGATTVTVSYGVERKVEPMVEVGTRPDPAVYVTVADDGPGIDPGFLPRVFEKFEKSSFSSGTGLGLYMARTIVEALDGSIAVQTSSRGTTFEVAIPAVAAAEPAGRL